ncbi:hypothetical protein CKF58_01635 [Psittacicella hinzii]|uniref:Autotransporter domain-containing protein n=1 Tax=Psittacicella hinzii TaxID=2028575 RepID=A0A3A1YRC9_9GAMM|nr:hypothetical protein CKF58_01635 [Psittacicella hinzii]
MGLVVSAGKAYERAWLSTSVFAFSHRYKVERSSLESSDQSANISAGSFGASVQAGYLVFDNAKAGMEVNGGLTAQVYSQSGFTETAATEEAAALSLSTKSRITTNAYANLGTKLWYNFTAFSFNHSLDASLNLYQRLTENRFNVITTAGDRLAHGFTNGFLAELSVGYNVHLTEKLSIRLAGGFSKAKDWKSTDGKLTFKYTF